MGEDVIQTDVDRLIEILKIKKKIPLTQLAKELNTDEDVVQNWVDFLVEEKIVTMEYDFTKPIIQYIEQDSDTQELTNDEYEKYKQRFKDHAAKEKGQSEFAWKQHVLEKLEQKKHFFFLEAEKRNLKNIEELWEEYKEKASEL